MDQGVLSSPDGTVTKSLRQDHAAFAIMEYCFWKLVDRSLKWPFYNRSVFIDDMEDLKE